jgi:DNA-directed RNA polymerase subunit L
MNSAIAINALFNFFNIEHYANHSFATATRTEEETKPENFAEAAIANLSNLNK